MNGNFSGAKPDHESKFLCVAMATFDPEGDYVYVADEVEFAFEDPQQIPVVSTWGMLVVVALLLTGITVKFRRRRGSAKAA
ncbi:unnamed protein product [marine sediment metagenome]|uniref:Uncharacterized protein n=1 Tax=marine sediment metagenome TaxID=412755 RepID=X0YTG2_9ZZZZ